MIDALHEIFSSNRVKTDADSLSHWGRDWTRSFTVAPRAVVFPESIDEVVALVRLARANGYGLVPSGGRTGLSGGAVAGNGEIVVSFDRMNKILAFDPADRIVRCQAGVVTQVLQQYAAERGLFYPVDFASSGSSQIGGNVSTNAGGIKVIRYGLTRDWVAGLTVVTGTGEVLELNRGLVKNATGYDLRHLFIGAEGTLGFVVEAQIKLAAAPEPQTVMVLGVPRFQDVLAVLARFQQDIELSAFEFFSELALTKVMAHRKLRRPLTTPADFYALVEFDASMNAAAAGGLRSVCRSGLGHRRRAVAKRNAGEGSVATARRASPKASRRIRRIRTTCRCASPRCPDFSKRSIASSPPRIPISKCAGTATSATATCTSTS